MTKEKFAYELINQYVYFACIGTMIVENYYMSNETEQYYVIVKNFCESIKWYKELQTKCRDVSGSLKEERMDCLLEMMINSYHEQVKKDIIDIFVKIRCKGNLDNLDQLREEIKQKLFFDKRNEYIGLNADRLINYLKEIRVQENADC